MRFGHRAKVKSESKQTVGADCKEFVLQVGTPEAVTKLEVDPASALCMPVGSGSAVPVPRIFARLVSTPLCHRQHLHLIPHFPLDYRRVK